jgi:hypothetical protein
MNNTYRIKLTRSREVLSVEEVAPRPCDPETRIYDDVVMRRVREKSVAAALAWNERFPVALLPTDGDRS